MRQNVHTHSGNKIVVEFDGQQIGLIQTLRANDSYGLEDASGIGDIHVLEHVPTKAVHVLSVTKMELIVGNMRRAGLIPQNGDDALRGLVMDINVYDKASGTFLYGYRGCSYDSGDLDVSAHRIVMGSGQFKALDRVGTMI